MNVYFPSPPNPIGLMADVGLPMIFLTLPLMIGALIPVILIEAWVVRPILGVSNGKTVGLVTAANVVSTIIGVPLAWLATLAVDYLMLLLATASPRWLDIQLKEGPVLRVLQVILFPAWLAPDEPDFFWSIPLATMILLIPSFFASWYIEMFVIRQMLKSEPSKIRAASFKANAFSYGFLVLAACVWLAFSIVRAR